MRGKDVTQRNALIFWSGGLYFFGEGGLGPWGTELAACGGWLWYWIVAYFGRWGHRPIEGSDVMGESRLVRAGGWFIFLGEGTVRT